MSPKRAALPGKDALFGPAPEEPVAVPVPADAEPPPVPQAAPAPVAVGPASVPIASSRHVQLCVWIAPEVAGEVDRARAHLLLELGVRATKSEIVEAVLAPALPDLETLCRLLAR